MDERTEKRVTRASMGAAVASAVAASLCCVGPIIAVSFGVTSLAALAKYEPFRPFFSILTIIILGAAFYMTYRRPPADNCEPDSVCSTSGGQTMQRVNRVMLWVVAAIAIIILTFPAWSAWVLS